MPTAAAGAPQSGHRSRSTIRRLRLLAPIVAISVLAAVAFADQLLILDANPSEPRFAGIHRANHALPWGYAVAALLWITSFLPRLTDQRRIRSLRLTNALLVASGIVWALWAFTTSA